jgi:hypothetical protein
MAFNKINLYNLNSMPPGFATYKYQSDVDTRVDVSDAGYFNNSDDTQNLAVNDTINVVGTEGEYALKVSSISSGVVTTFSTTPTNNPALIPPPKLLETRITDFSGSHGFALSGNGTVANDAVVHLNGTQSLKYTSPGDSSFGAARSGAFSPTIDMTGKGFIIRVLLADIANVESGDNNLNFYASSDTNFASDWYTWDFLKNSNGKQYVVEGEWAVISLGFGDATTSGTPDRTAIIKVQMVLDDAGTGTIKLNWATLGTFKEQPRGKVVLAFDQGHDDQYDQGKKKMSEYGFPGMSYIRTDLVGVSGRVTYDELLELQDLHGWEIALRTQGTHPDDSGTIQDKEELIDADIQIMSEEGFPSIYHFAYANTDFDKLLYDLIKRKFRSGRHGGNETILETYPPGDWNAVRCNSVGPSTSTATLAGFVDQAVTNKQMIVILFHQITAAGTEESAISIAKFGTFIDDLQTHVVAGDIDVVTMSQAMDDVVTDIDISQSLSGAGAVDILSRITEFTSTGVADALTLADGAYIGQRKTVAHVVDGGSGVLTPANALGFTDITFTTAGESVELVFLLGGWLVVGIGGVSATLPVVA